MLILQTNILCANYSSIGLRAHRIGTDDNLRLDHQLCFALYAASHAVTRAYREGLGKLGLTYPQYLVLLALWDEGTMSVGQLARRLQLDPSTLSPILKRLAETRFVVRERDPDEERVVRISLSRKAHDIRRRLAPLQSKVACDTGHDEKSFRALRTSLHELSRTMASRREQSIA